MSTVKSKNEIVNFELKRWLVSCCVVLCGGYKLKCANKHTRIQTYIGIVSVPLAFDLCIARKDKIYFICVCVSNDSTGLLQSTIFVTHIATIQINSEPKLALFRYILSVDLGVAQLQLQQLNISMF